MTYSTEDPGAERSRRRWLRWVEIATVVAAVAGVIALVPSFGAWINDLLHNPSDPGGTVAPTATTTTTATTAPAPPGPVAWKSLWTVQMVAGAWATAPDAVRDDARYRDARFVECPDNQIARRTELRFDLGKHYQAVRLEVRAWGDTDAPDRMNVSTFTRTVQTDGQLSKDDRAATTLEANGPSQALEFRTPDVKELVVQLECERPHQMLAITGASLQPR